MARLEEIQVGSTVRGAVAGEEVAVVGIRWFGPDALEMEHRDSRGRVAKSLFYRHHQSRLELVEEGGGMSLEAEGHLWRLIFEAHLIRAAAESDSWMVLQRETAARTPSLARLFYPLWDQLERMEQESATSLPDLLERLRPEGRPLEELIHGTLRPEAGPGEQARQIRRLQDAVGAAARPRDPDPSWDRARLNRIHPYRTEAFFHEAFVRCKGILRPLEGGRLRIQRVPISLRKRDQAVGSRYESVAFGNDPGSERVFPGHPLFRATLGLLLDTNRSVLQKGTMLVDEEDPGNRPRMLLLLGGDHRLLAVETGMGGSVFPMERPSHLDYRPLERTEPSARKILQHPRCAWLEGGFEQQALEHAGKQGIPSPSVLGRALIVPSGLLVEMASGRSQEPPEEPEERLVELAMERERELGRHPRKRPRHICGYDLESRDGRTGRLRFIGVAAAGRDQDALDVSQTQNLFSLSHPGSFRMAVVDAAASPPSVTYLPSPLAPLAPFRTCRVPVSSGP